jgi:MFS family permease
MSPTLAIAPKQPTRTGWVLLLTSVAFFMVITAASIGERFRRRRVYVAGLALFTLASAACALAPSTTLLIAARAMQGLGAAIVTPLSLTILTTAFGPNTVGA